MSATTVAASEPVRQEAGLATAYRLLWLAVIVDLLAFGVGFGCVEMGGSVDFDCEFFGGAVEIQDEAADWVLATELSATQPAVTQGLP